MLFLFVVAEAHVQKHSLQTAQNLLQEEVAHAEEHSEVKTHRRAKAVKTELVSLVLAENQTVFHHVGSTLAAASQKPLV